MASFFSTYIYTYIYNRIWREGERVAYRARLSDGNAFWSRAVIYSFKRTHLRRKCFITRALSSQISDFWKCFFCSHLRRFFFHLRGRGSDRQRRPRRCIRLLAFLLYFMSQTQANYWNTFQIRVSTSCFLSSPVFSFYLQVM